MFFTLLLAAIALTLAEHTVVDLEKERGVPDFIPPETVSSLNATAYSGR